VLFICAADLHITNKVPKNRKGDYFSQIIDKFKFILKTAEKTDSKILVIAGDFFDSAMAPYKVTRKVLEFIQKSNVNILSVTGQHDQRYHVSGLNNTPLGILQAANVIHILKNNEVYKSNGISFVGAGWGEIPEIEADVLVIHKMIVKKDPLWPGQTNYSSAYAILRKYPWSKAIISGDNHLPHSLCVNGAINTNCGSMMRSTKSQINFQPRIYRVNTADWTSQAIKIPCLPSKDVFDFGKIAIAEMKDESKKLAEEKISKFIDSLPKNQREKPNFKTILQSVINQTNPKKNVRDIISNTMERIA